MVPIDAIWLLFFSYENLCLSLCGSPPSAPIEVLMVLATPLNNYPKWQAIQLTIHSTVGA